MSLAPDLDDRPTRRLWTVVASLVTAGGVLLAFGVSRLPAAHLSRQRTGEGLGFAFASVAYFPANVVLAFTACFLWDRSTRTASLTGRRHLRWATAGIAVIVIAADALYLWVSWHGDRCIGPCG